MLKRKNCGFWKMNKKKKRSWTLCLLLDIQKSLCSVLCSFWQGIDKIKVSLCFIRKQDAELQILFFFYVSVVYWKCSAPDGAWWQGVVKLKVNPENQDFWCFQSLSNFWTKNWSFSCTLKPTQVRQYRWEKEGATRGWATLSNVIVL